MGRAGARVTLNDVAAASGVSRATASFVLRDSPGQSISAATRERVREAARALGYVPNGIARALREGTSRIVVLTIDLVLEGNYARSYIGGLDAELAAHEHVLLVRYTRGEPGRRGEAGGPDSRLTDAIAPRAVLRFGEPYLTGRELDDSGGGWRDGLAAHVTAQVGYLAARGHARIALALPSFGTPLRAVRQHFADQAAAALGLPPLVPFVLPAGQAGGAGGAQAHARPVPPAAVPPAGQAEDTAGTPGSARPVPPASSVTEAADALHALRDADGGVTAVAAFDDDVALRVLAAMRPAGLSAPGDLAVIGFDDNGYGALSSPALTTVHIDAEAHGRQAARAILGRSAAGLSPTPGRVIVRESAYRRGRAVGDVQGGDPGARKSAEPPGTRPSPPSARFS
jgi:DNA-binding LacI/PurR family transcriptional regulator